MSLLPEPLAKAKLASVSELESPAFRKFMEERNTFAKESNLQMITKHRIVEPLPIIRGDDIILVGNGPSILGQRLGPRIDTFAHIVRFNGYELAGFEEHVGTRTTIWSRWYALPTTRPMAGLERIWLNMPIHERTEEKTARALTFLDGWTHKVEIIPGYNVAAGLQRALFGGPHDSKWPSSGLLAIAHAVSMGCNITIAGFDFWSEEPFHYYGPHDRSNTHHMADLERAYVSELLHAGVVRRLN